MDCVAYAAFTVNTKWTECNFTRVKAFAGTISVSVSVRETTKGFVFKFWCMFLGFFQEVKSCHNDVWKNNRRDSISRLFLSVFMSVRYFPIPPLTPHHAHTHTHKRTHPSQSALISQMKSKETFRLMSTTPTKDNTHSPFFTFIDRGIQLNPVCPITWRLF